MPDCGIFNLEGKVAIVTGGNRGLGKGMAVGLAEFGADVVITARTGARDAEEVAERIKQLGRRALVVKCDVSRREDVERLVRESIEAFGKIDILVNNAGVSGGVKPLLETPEEKWDEVMATNLKGVYLCTRAVGEVMVRRGYGSIINVSSQLGLVGAPNEAVYCASKGGVTLFTKAVALEWAKYGVRVNAIAPGYFFSQMSEWLRKDPEKQREITSKIPLGRLGEPEELVGSVVYLASDASRMVTGAVLSIDGGYSAG